MNPARWGGGQPTVIPALGVILDLAPADWRYPTRGDQRLHIRVDRIRLDISQWYAKAWLWIEGPTITNQGPEATRQALIRVEAIPPALRDPNYQPEHHVEH